MRPGKVPVWCLNPGGGLYGMSDTPKVSVIVPVYNPGNLVLRGLRSLCRQTLTDIEILLVNDGSRKETLTEVRKAAEEDKRIRILKTEVNSGAGIARNLGIENACGKYLAFMDADDYISPDFLELLYRKAELYRAEIAKGSLIHVSQNGKIKKTQTSGGENSKIRNGIKDGLPLYTLFRFDHYSAIYHREWIQACNIRYGNSRYGEDSTFLLRATAEAKHMVFDDRASYYLVDQPDSLMKHMTQNRLEEQLLALHEQVDYLIGHFGETIDPDYEMQRIRWTLGVQAAAVRQGNLEQQADAFLNGIQAEVMRLPNLPELVIYSPMVGALVEYRENLCSILMRDTEQNYEENALIESITRCFRFASFHRERRDLYEAPLRESLKRGFGYMWGKDGFHDKGLSLRRKVRFTGKLIDELRRNTDPLFWKINMKQWLAPRKLFAEGKKAIRKVKKQ